MEKVAALEGKTAQLVTVGERIYTITISAEEVCAILTSHFPQMGDNVDIHFSVIQGYFDHVVLKSKKTSVESIEIPLDQVGK